MTHPGKILTGFFILLAIFSNGQNCSVAVTGLPENCGISCNGSAEANPTGQGSFTYLWQPTGQTTQQISNLCPGNYTVIVTDSVGCVAIDSITISTAPALTGVLYGFPQYCDSFGTLYASISGGVAPYQVNWQPGNYAGTSVFNVPLGTYTAVITDSVGCTFTDIVTVSPSPSVIAWISNIIAPTCQTCFDGSATGNFAGGSGIYSCMWYPTLITTNVHNNMGVGSYTFCVTDDNGCTACADTVITFSTGTQVILDASVIEISIVEVFDLSGRLIWHGTPQQYVAFRPEIVGIYFVVMQNKSGVVVRREKVFLSK
ncbi:MAG TPA: T9SS type A sorting domain-containing protein [Bacteroidia bacterium]|nr:T9SS type A sorting domain-containing protein [Bacteroidia bacterium]